MGWLARLSYAWMHYRRSGIGEPGGSPDPWLDSGDFEAIQAVSCITFSWTSIMAGPADDRSSCTSQAVRLSTEGGAVSCTNVR
ncbi:MAG: hypothetical protein CMF59_20005 [Leptospiraceae bacterium]|nr:hypothetical protein [Leptospiraceae bacterium]